MRPFVPAGPPRFQHQLRGLRKLIETKGICALLFDPGTGKTATTLDYASLLALKAPSGEARVLVVAPLAAVDTWVQQAQVYVHEDIAVWAEALRGTIKQRASILAVRGNNPLPRNRDYTGARRMGDVPRAAGWHRALDLQVRDRGNLVDPRRGPDGLSKGPRLVLEVVNLDAFSSRAAIEEGSSITNTDMMIEAVKRFAPDMLVVDESHRIKSANSNTSRALSRLTNAVPRRVLLTGTVMPHSPLDVFGQWRFMAPYAFGHTVRGERRPASFGRFRDRYAKMGGWMGKQVVGFQNLDEMQEIMAQNSVVARKEDALDLPKTTEVVVPVSLSSAEQRAYQQMKNELAAELADGTLTSAPNRLTQMMRLRQITSGFLHDTDTGVTDVIGESKARVIRSIVHDTLAGEKRIVVFAHFRHEIAHLAEMLGSKDTEILTITGDTPSEDRLLHRKRFGSDDPARIVLIAQTRTMSLAVNELVTASHAIYGSLSLQRDDQIQSQDRLNRLGQTRPVTFWMAVAPKTVDEVISLAHRNRTDLESAMLKHIQE